MADDAAFGMLTSGLHCTHRQSEELEAMIASGRVAAIHVGEGLI